MNRKIAIGVAGIVSLLSGGCALPSREQWAQVSERGLIPVLIDANRSDAAGNRMYAMPSQQRSIKPVSDPREIVRTPMARPVPDRPGFVYSPYSGDPKVVDVRGFQAGVKVRCPFTAQPFIVPAFNFTETPSVPVPSSPVQNVVTQPHPVTPAAPNPPVVPPLDPALAHLEPTAPVTPAAAVPPVPAPPVTAAHTPSRPAVTPSPTVKPNTPATATAKAGIPYGVRVPGQPGHVYSPFTGKTQIVDVAGMAPGIVAKCPYTNKLFRVPEPLSEEVKPEVFPSPPATETASSAPAVPPEKKETPRPPAPSPVNPGNALGAPPPH